MHSFPPISLIPGAIAELFAQVSRSGRLTLADRYGLMAALCEESLNEDERRAIDRLLRAALRGHLQISTELSAMLELV
jgi:hypothetical protein